MTASAAAEVEELNIGHGDIPCAVLVLRDGKCGQPSVTRVKVWFHCDHTEIGFVCAVHLKRVTGVMCKTCLEPAYMWREI